MKFAAVIALGAGLAGVSGQAALAATSDDRRPATAVAIHQDDPSLKDLVVKALRAGGPLLAQLLREMSPEAADWVKKNAAALADYLEAHDWSYAAIKKFLVDHGCPESVAHVIAKVLSEIAD
ncbi:hypothetical protein [Pilimelia anulata]|uniref:hypothetical protein n=1 Tax=Pilimelia anulata TaxID=53371 RepID=UPI001669574F|nr:hypothetical protein [Pilimelia anulata]